MKKTILLTLALLVSGCATKQPPDIKSVETHVPPRVEMTLVEARALLRYYECREQEGLRKLPLIELVYADGDEEDIINAYRRYVGRLVEFIKEERKACDRIVDAG